MADVNKEDIYSSLLHRIRECGKLGKRLPSEDVLAMELGISRVKLRDVLALLEAEGYINRRKKLGTIANTCVMNHSARLDVDIIYEDAIRDAGYIPGTTLRKIRCLKAAPEEVVTCLKIAADQQVWNVEKIITVDGKPFVFMQDYILPQYFNSENIDMELLAKSTFSYVQRYTDSIMESNITAVSAVCADEAKAKILSVEKGHPLLKQRSCCYTFFGDPVMCSVEHQNTELMKFYYFNRLQRTKLYSEE